MEVFKVFSRSRGPYGFVPGQSSPSSGSGPQGFVPGQSSTALGGADDVDDLIWRSQELIEYTRREFSFSSGAEEEDEEDETAEEEEETEQMDFEVVSAGGARRAFSRTRTSSTRTCTESGDCCPVIMQPEFQ